jgi:hypothetical protein
MVLVLICPIFFLTLQIDEEILQEVVNRGFDREQLIASLRSRVQNEV